MPDALDQPRRTVFYGRRRGKTLRPRGQELLKLLLPRLVVPRPGPDDHLDPRSLFDTPLRAVWLEVGFGGGEHLAAQAEAHRDVGILGGEAFINGVVSLLNHVDRNNLRNVRIYPDDIRHLFPALPDGCLEKVFVLFPDPWPKNRHVDRRFIGPANLPELARLLVPGGELRVASDDPTYIEWAHAQLCHSPWFDLDQAVRERPADWAPTRYEAKALRAGRIPLYMTARARTRQ